MACLRFDDKDSLCRMEHHEIRLAFLDHVFLDRDYPEGVKYIVVRR